MKKVLFTSLFLAALLTSLAGTASAAPLAGGSTSLVGVEYVPSKGPVFTFSVDGKSSKSELKGTLQVQNGSNYSLHCTQVDEDTVTCNSSKQIAGVNVTINWGGSTFWAYVPEARNARYCYEVYDWNVDGLSNEWVNFGTYCQDSPANYGDFIIWYNSGWEGTYPYVFLPESPDSDWCPYYHAGDAYYFPVCDDEIGF